ncbi:MAG: 50S ribosomal protein L11 methyltransferase [Epsilonproteobacteria bacterium]|nr:50S ribosomal protein L11 methyltransferase [Campylobacterota bacterium]
MDQYYYELIITPSSHRELFADFLNDITPIGYEEKDESFIIRSEENLETLSWGVEQFCEALSKAVGTNIECEIELKKQKNSDWIEEYQKSITPVEIGRFYIHPTWEEPKEDLINIAIDPALAFGTGHHPTTATCLEAISAYVETEDEVIDVGCGSGILSIAAMKLGAIVDGCDTDPVSVENAIKNAKLNGVSYREIWEGSINKATKKYDVVVANIVADVLIFIANDLKKHLKDQDSYLVLSGILNKYEKKVLLNYQDCHVVQRFVKDEWVSLVLQKKDVK